MPSNSETIPSPTDIGALGNRINTSTRKAHDVIDKAVTLVFGIAMQDPKIYRQGLQSFYHVFATVERCLDHQFKDGRAEDKEIIEILREVYKPEIRRAERLRLDLLTFYNNQEAKFASPIMPEQIAFVNHIETVTAAKPHLLLAYLHVMYLALFAGGRMMRAKLATATALFPATEGQTTAEAAASATKFFTFDVESEDAFRAEYKRDYEIATRNALTEEQKLEILEEAQYIFLQNGACILEIKERNLQLVKAKMLRKVANAVVAVAGVAGIAYAVNSLYKRV